MTATGTEYEPDERKWVVRLLVRIFGKERLTRAINWPPPPPPPRERCPWISPDGEQCTHDAGHKHSCHTVIVHTNKQTGKQSVNEHYWYGINYDD